MLAQSNAFLLVGTYTSGKSEGIYVYKFDTNTGESALLSTVRASNPSYLAVAPNQQTVYAVTEDAEVTKSGTGGGVSSFSFNKETGTLKTLNEQFSGGKHPCYVAVDQTGKWVFAGNYSSGSFGILPVKSDGSLDAAKQVIQHTGSGPDKGRQEGPHVHSTVLSPDNKYLYVPDLGIDKVMIYRFDNTNGLITKGPQEFAQSLPGSGPRHFEFSPTNSYAYLMEEMSGTVVVYKYKKGKLKNVQRINALPEGFKGVIGSADIHVSPDGKFLYCSNRGESNTITIFTINPRNGKLTVAGHQSTLGKTPRNFNFDPSGNFLLVANQDTDDIIIFKRNKETGLLSETGKKINVPKPVCIKWITQ
jgi:6-phosphogluconolactonase